jgi:hypothetical protein
VGAPDKGLAKLLLRYLEELRVREIFRRLARFKSDLRAPAGLLRRNVTIASAFSIPISMSSQVDGERVTPCALTF